MNNPILADYTEIQPVSRETIEQLKMLDLHPVPPEWVPRVPKVEPGKWAAFVRDDVVENGNATNWKIYNYGGELEWCLDGRIPCSLAWCKGHEEYYEWDALSHYGHATEPATTVMRLDAEVSVDVRFGGEPRVAVTVDMGHDFALEEIPGLVTDLNELIRTIQLVADKAREADAEVNP